MFRAVLLAVVLTGCAATIRGTTGKCPKVAPLLTDFVIGSAGLAASVLAFNERREGESLLWAGAAMSVFTSANLAGDCR